MKKLPLELLFWTGALCYLACIDPSAEHMSLCVFRWLGISWCPGCGVGHSISYALHGNWAAAWKAHFFGIPALIILMYRIAELIYHSIKIRPITINHNQPKLPL